ncbi:MAG: outer membrane lipid asymmetry maintenance protein MlaD [Gemmobacter sp.]
MAREARSEILAGLAVLIVAAGFGLHLARAAGPAAPAAGYELSAAFRAADGVRVGTEVRIAGVRVGSVTALDLDPATFQAVARLGLPGDLELPTDTAAIVATEGLLGGTYVALVPGGALETLGPGEAITDTQGSVDLVTLLLKVVGGE